MRMLTKRNTEAILLALAFALIFAMSVSWTAARKGQTSFAVFLVFTGAFSLILTAWLISAICSARFDKIRQILFPLFILSLSALVCSVNDYRIAPSLGDQRYCILMSLVGGYFLIASTVITFYLGLKNELLPYLRALFFENKLILAFVLLVSIIPVIASYTMSRWDSSILARYLYGSMPGDALDYDLNLFAGHVSQAFVWINYHSVGLFDSLTIGQAVPQLVLFLYSIYSVYKILRKILPDDRKDIELIGLTAIYALSPFVFGLSNYYFYDQWCIYLMPILIYTYLYDKMLLHFFFAVIMCFSKEPAVLAYAGFCAGMVLNDCINRRFSAHLRRYFGMLLVGGSWFAVYSAFPKWGGDGGFSFDIEYALSKLKVFYLLNFNWIILLIAVITIIVLIRKKNTLLFRLVIPLLISDILFVGFNVIFKTVNHARYIDTHVCCLYLIALIGLGMIGSVKKRNISAAFLSILLLVSNWKTFDPVTVASFSSYDMGNGTMINTGVSKPINDNCVYNREYLGLDRAVNLALKDVVEEGKMIYFPCAYEGESWNFEGVHYFMDPEVAETEWWIQNRQVRTALNYDGGKPFSLKSIFHADEIDEAGGYFFSIPCLGWDVLDELREKGRIEEEKQYTSGSFTVTRAKVKGLSTGHVVED